VSRAEKVTGKVTRLAASLALVSAWLIAAAAPLPSDDVLLERLEWWRTADHVLDIAALSPLEPVPAGGGTPIAVALKPKLDPKAAAAAIAYVAALHTQSLLVWQGGALQLEWYGPGYGPDSRSSPASMMKPVLALAVGQAIAGAKIKSVDEPIGTYLREWSRDERGSITIRQLLQMSSGLHKDGPTGSDPRGTQLMLGTDMERVLLETTLDNTPGSVFDYNNINSSLLGLILQRATGERFAAWLSRSVWQPIGARAASVWLDRPGGLARSFCCLMATGRDWLRVGLLVKNRGRVDGQRVVDPNWIDAMTAPSLRNPNFGYDIWRADPYTPLRGYGSGGAAPVPSAQPFLAPDIVYFDGSGGQRVYISAAKDLVIVRIGTAAKSWDDSALPNIVVGGLPSR
jgi:CubicO group peptidase (beta-lactamase class C family)